MTENSAKSYSATDRLWKGLLMGMIAVAVSVGPDLAAGQTIETNRPSFTFSPNIAEPGQWQLETGVSYTRSDDDAWTTSLPSAEIRTGLGGEVEVFLSSLSWSETSSAGSKTSGLVDMALGTKIKISEADARTQMALLFQLSVPVGDRNFSSDRWDPSVAFIWAHSGDFSIAGTVKVSEFNSGYQVDNGLTIPFSWSEVHSGFVEWEVNLPEGGGNTHWLNGGYQWLIEDHIQLDFNAGLGLNDRAGDYRMGAGFSIRL